MFKPEVKFYKQSLKAEGEICPCCGSTNVERWEKSKDYYGYNCSAKDCPLHGEGYIVHEYKTKKKVKSIELPYFMYEE